MMSEIRIPHKKSRYFLPKETFLTVVHYCKQYPLWVAELNALADPRKAIAYTKDKIESSGNSDPTFEYATRRAKIEEKKSKVDEVSEIVAGMMSQWLILGVCYGFTFQQLHEKNIPCGKDLYYKMRRQFYFEMAKRV